MGGSELFKQKFGIAFEPYTASTIATKSGNPGYVPQNPLLVSTGLASGAQQVPVDGFFARTSETCDKLSSNQVRVDFLNDILLSCQKTFTDKASFDTYCTDADIKDIPMVSQFIDGFASVGVFGNADISHTKDWLDVIISEVITLEGELDAERNSCIKKVSLQIEVLYSQVGFKDDPQDYIVGVQMSTQASQWIYEQDKVYNHFVSISYRQVESGTMTTNEMGAVMNVNGELFYPLMLGNT